MRALLPQQARLAQKRQDAPFSVFASCKPPLWQDTHRLWEGVCLRRFLTLFVTALLLATTHLPASAQTVREAQKTGDKQSREQKERTQDLVRLKKGLSASRAGTPQAARIKEMLADPPAALSPTVSPASQSVSKTVSALAHPPITPAPPQAPSVSLVSSLPSVLTQSPAGPHEDLETPYFQSSERALATMHAPNAMMSSGSAPALLLGPREPAPITTSWQFHPIPLHVLPLSALADRAAPNIIGHVAVQSDWNNSGPIQYGIFDENGMSLMQRVNLPLNEQHLLAGGAPPLPNPEAVLPKMFWNEWLRDRGVAIMLDNTNEFAGAITSPTKGLGLKQGASNAGQYSLENDIDWGKLAGIPGFETHMIGVGRYGIPASRMFGDNINPSSEIYGGGGNVFFHMVFFYGEETLFNGRLNIAAGRMSMLWDYSNSPIYCNFMNNAFCGNPKTSTDMYSRSSYPGSNWGLRVRGRPTNNIYIQAGIYFPDRGIYGNTENRTGFKFNGADISGVQVPVEIGWEPQFGPDHLQGHYKIGASPDTARHFLGVYNPPNARNDASTGMYTPDGYAVPGTGKLRHFAWGVWLLADQMILRHHTRDTMEGGLIAFAGAYWNKPDISMRGKLYEFGLVDTGFWPARPLDTVGVAFSYTGSSRYTRQAQRFQMAHGMSPPNGSPHWNNVGDTASGPLMWGSYGVQRWGSTLEAMYRFHVTRGVTFAPDFQYYFNPGMQRRLKDAAMLGFKSHIQLF